MSTSPPIRQIPEGKFVTLTKVQPVGSLQARKLRTGAILLYWRYSFGPESERVAIGTFDPAAPPKTLTRSANGTYSVAAAVRAAELMSLEHYASRERGGRPEQNKREKEERATKAQLTLQALLNAYCDYLESLGRRSFRDAKSIFQLHIFEAHPETAQRPASDVTSEHIADMMRRLIDAGRGRTANKLRAYVHAAYAVAKKARSSGSVPVTFKAFLITSNPVSETEADSSSNQADKNPLDLEELRIYWKAIKRLEGFKGALLRLHLLTGSQRIEQLVNLRTERIHADHFVLLDGKGRPGKKARHHKVPLLAEALRALKECDPSGVHALSTDGGETHVAATTLSRWAVEAASEAKIKGFQAKRLRSGVETALAAAEVSIENRGHLQSHGISGVQARHYDDHDYLPRKRAALETLWALLEPASANPTAKRQPKQLNPRRPARLVDS